MGRRRRSVRVRLLGCCAGFVLASGFASAVDRDQDGQPWPADCNDGNSRVVGHATTEYCDGWSNSCTGIVDPGCLRACPSPRPGAVNVFGASAGSSVTPRAAASNKGFDVVWVDTRDGNQEIYLARLDPFGQPLYPERRISTDPAASTAPSIASPGGWRGIAWVDERDHNKEIYFSRISDAGLGDASEARITNTSVDDVEPCLAWAGRQWAIAYVTGRNKLSVRLQLVSDPGAPLTSVAVTTNAAGAVHNPSVAFTGNGYGIVWDDDRNGQTEIYFRAFDDALGPATGEIRLTNAAGASTRPSIVWAGDRFVVAWRDERDGNPEAYLQVVDPAGAPSGSPLRLTMTASATEAPRLVWTAAEILVEWMDAPSGSPAPFLARVRPDGTLLEAGRAVAAPAAGATSGDVAWNGIAPFVVWENTPGGEIRGDRARCCGDLDGDGVDLCDGDCNDGDPMIHPGATELCNGVDDDCNGTIDEGCDTTCAGPDLSAPATPHVGSTANFIHDTDLATNGATIGAVWEEDDRPSQFPENIFFQHLALDGTPIGPVVEIADGGPSIYNFRPAITARPGGWAVLHEWNTNTASVDLLDPDGAPVGAPSRWDPFGRLTTPGIVWDGRGFGVVYQAASDSLSGQYVEFARLSPGGPLLGNPVQLNTVVGTDGVSLVWNGSEYWVVSSQFGSAQPYWSLYLDRFDGEGRRLVGGQRIVDGGFYALSQPSIGWTGSGYLVAYVSNNQIIQSVALDASGNPTYQTQYSFVNHYVTAPRLAWNGQEFLLQWTDTDAHTLDAVLATPEGFPLTETAVVSSRDGGLAPWDPAGCVPTPGGWLSGWGSYGVTPVAMRTRALGCCHGFDPDSDGDFYCAADCAPHDPAINPAAAEACDGLDNNCDGTVDNPPAPAGSPSLTIERSPYNGETILYWPEMAGATGWDLLRGDLTALHGSGGDFSVSTGVCLANDYPGRSFGDFDVPATDGFWYLLRGVACASGGTWNDLSPSQQGNRDPGIAAAPTACP